MGIKKQAHSEITIRGAAQQLKKGTLNLNHRIQRRGAWTELQKQLFISSILENVKIPGIVTVEIDNVKYALDGKQRITAGVEFFEGKFALNENIEFIEDIELEELESEESIALEDIAGKYYTDLPSAVKDKLHQFQFKLDVYKELTDKQIKKLFKRYNGGTPLTKAQLLHCDSDFMNDDINYINSQPFFANVINITSNAKNKFIDENVIKQSLALLYYANDTGVEDKDLQMFVAEMEGVKNLPEYTELIEDMKEITDYLSEALTEPIKDFRRTHVPVIVAVAKKAIVQEIESERFGIWVKKFLTENTGKKAGISRYKDISAGGASKKASITERIELVFEHFNENIINIEGVQAQDNNSQELENEKAANEIMQIIRSEELSEAIA